MKKTLIALAVAASAVVSGSAMAAWTANGGGGQVEIGGSLTPVTKSTPWETAVGAAVTNLNGQVQKNDTKLEITVPKTLPILAIRSTAQFTGRAGIIPTINYGWLGNDWSNSSATGTAEVRNEAGEKIGKAVFPLTVQGVVAAAKLNGGSPVMRLLGANKGQGFFGGLPTSTGSVADVRSVILEGWPDIKDKYVIPDGATWASPWSETFSDSGWKFSSYYGSVIAKNSMIKMTMDAPVSADASFKWKIGLPATVTYQ
ncbi:hypothetical protein HUL39_004480 [Salmonella enterica]|nr:hypothetical protein [Salmonella enterica]EBX7446011.1 hypothetical protein [Salmonella enterica subsp. enterica serovar Chester]EBZ4888543.1 hypothetical protein [Salmonella enterica subsp. enterica serovar Bredeney]ECK0418874.1 hypothetical protein [Salmonella enterica subsp. enterica serovar Minnesota]EBP0843298.1 hypothetical protein [Salmonella enterica]